MESDLYEHLKDPNAHHDTQTLDTADTDQQQDQEATRPSLEEDQEDMVDSDDSREVLPDDSYQEQVQSSSTYTYI